MLLVWVYSIPLLIILCFNSQSLRDPDISLCFLIFSFFLLLLFSFSFNFHSTLAPLSPGFEILDGADLSHELLIFEGFLAEVLELTKQLTDRGWTGWVITHTVHKHCTHSCVLRTLATQTWYFGLRSGFGFTFRAWRLSLGVELSYYFSECLGCQKICWFLSESVPHILTTCTQWKH